MRDTTIAKGGGMIDNLSSVKVPKQYPLILPVKVVHRSESFGKCLLLWLRSSSSKIIYLFILGKLRHFVSDFIFTTFCQKVSCSSSYSASGILSLFLLVASIFSGS